MSTLGLSPLRGLAKLREAKTRRFSSYDRTGGNDDRFHIEPGKTEVIAEYAGAGIITHIWATLACESENFLRKITLRAYWDGETEPSIEAPIGDFFGMGHGRTGNYASLPMQASPEDGKAFNCYFPMPFGSQMKLTLLVQQTNRFNAVMRSMFFAPNMVSLVVVALVWQFMVIDKIGVVSQALAAIGIDGVSFLGNPNFALVTVVFVSVWFLMGFYMLIFLGGLQDIPRQYYEAAMIDGAGPVARFRYITLPLLKPTSFFVVMVSMVAAVAGSQAFDIIYVMTKGGPANATAVLIVYIYQQAFSFGAFGYAAAMSSILVIALMLVTIVFFAITKGGRFDHAE